MLLNIIVLLQGHRQVPFIRGIHHASLHRVMQLQELDASYNVPEM
jgi:hypothetical protein